MPRRQRYRCANCQGLTQYEVMKTDYIELPRGDLDLHSIWFGDVGDHLVFHDEKFCCFECLLAYIAKWHEGHGKVGKPAYNADRATADNDKAYKELFSILAKGRG